MIVFSPYNEMETGGKGGERERNGRERTELEPLEEVGGREEGVAL